MYYRCKNWRRSREFLNLIIHSCSFFKQYLSFLHPWVFCFHFWTYFRLLSREKDEDELKKPSRLHHLLRPEALSPKANIINFKQLRYSQFRRLHFSFSTQIMHILLLTASHCIFAERNVYLSRNSSVYPVSSHIQIQILQANLHTLPKRINWENLIDDQSIFSLVIILVILIAILNYLLTMIGYWGGGSRPSDKEGGAGHPDPEIRGGGAVSNFNFSALRASVWAKNKGGPGPPGAPPLDPPLSCVKKIDVGYFWDHNGYDPICREITKNHGLSTHCWF